MPNWTSKAQVQKALNAARLAAKKARAKHGPDSDQFKKAIRDCNAIQQVLDRWDAIHS